jgi:multisubunit Na+/H+ antiporter MnhB subunit
MAVSRGRPAFATDDWMQEQQLRAEAEAEGWRRLRSQMAVPQALPTSEPAQNPAEIDHHSAGSTILKAVVRFMLAAFTAYLAWLAGVDARLGEFDVWMVTGSTFAITLALSMFGAARGFVHAAAETVRWILLLGIGFGATWLAFNWPG